MQERTCKECLIVKPIESFHFYSKDSPSYKCKECHVESERKRQKALWANNPEYRERHNNYGKAVRRGEIPPKRVKVIRTEKVCKICNELKSMEEFPLSGTNRLNTCIPCYNQQQAAKDKERYRDDPEYRARKALSCNKYRWLKEYGVTVDEVVNTLASQNNKCANDTCGIEISLTAPKAEKKRAVVDHNHSTGKFRALLCDRCNIVLGHLEMNPSLIDGLQRYAQKHS